MLQERVYKMRIEDIHELQEHTADQWAKLDQRFVDKATGEWQKRLQACVVAKGQFEYKM